jgi:hypothetical protein
MSLDPEMLALHGYAGVIAIKTPHFFFNTLYKFHSLRFMNGKVVTCYHF